jgi:hypothetical protein
MATEMCANMGVTPVGTNGGIVDWIVNHPIESALMLLASGAITYFVYDSMKEKKYVPSKSKSSKSIKSK